MKFSAISVDVSKEAFGVNRNRIQDIGKILNVINLVHVYLFCNTGNEYPAVVEFAPYQKVPIVARKVDHRENTLDDGRYAQQLDSKWVKCACT